MSTILWLRLTYINIIEVVGITCLFSGIYGYLAPVASNQWHKWEFEGVVWNHFKTFQRWHWVFLPIGLFTAEYAETAERRKRLEVRGERGVQRLAVRTATA